MERPVKYVTGQAEMVFLFVFKHKRTAAGQRVSTVDHSDIRGSSARLAIMVVIRRELPRTKHAGQGAMPVA
jgi:hypothetical protein